MSFTKDAKVKSHRRGERSFCEREGHRKGVQRGKCCGFIQRSAGEDVFVHFSAIQENGYRTLNEGETVEFDLLKGPKGFQAANVSRGEKGPFPAGETLAAPPGGG